MSAEATFWAWRQEVKSSHKLTLLALANCHNENTGQCNPSIAYISKTTGLNRKTVMSALSDLELSGLIIPKKALGSGSHYSLLTGPYIGTAAVANTSPKSGTSPKNNTSPKTGTATSTENGHNQYRKRDTNLKETKKNLKDIYKKISLAGVDENLLPSVKEFVDHRINIKKPLTQEAFNRFLVTVSKTAIELSLSPEFVVSETIDAGWQSVKAEWLRNRLGENHAAGQSSNRSGPANGQIDHNSTDWMSGSDEGRRDTGEQAIQEADPQMHGLEASG